jgi:hypothetical protein
MGTFLVRNRKKASKTEIPPKDKEVSFSEALVSCLPGILVHEVLQKVRG